MNKGLFISFEGAEGSGKSTQARLLAQFLRRRGYKVVHLWDPGSTRLGESVRQILLTPGEKFSAAAEMLLYMACRAQLVSEKIAPALAKKAIVISDRYADATVAYQGYGLGVDKKMIERINRFVTRSIMPDITFFLDVDIKKGLLRSRGVKGFSDRIEQRSLRFHQQVSNGYCAIARRFPKRIKRIKVEQSDKEMTHRTIRRIVLDAITKNNRARPRG